MVDQFQQEVVEVQNNMHIDAIEAPVAGLHDDARLQQQEYQQRQIAPVAELNDDARLQQQADNQIAPVPELPAIEAPVAGLHDDARLEQQEYQQRQIAPVAELNDDARLQQQEDQQRQLQRELDYQVGLIDRAIVLPYPDNGHTYISRVQFDKENDRITTSISKPYIFNSLSDQMQAKLAEYKSIQIMKELEDRESLTQISREHPMSCVLCNDDFTSRDVDKNQWLTMLCNSPNCFGFNFVHVDCILVHFKSGQAEILQSTFNVCDGKSGNSWIHSKTNIENRLQCFNGCTGPIKGFANILTPAEVSAGRFIMHQNFTRCYWCKNQNITLTHLSECPNMSDYKNTESSRNIALIESMATYFNLDFEVFSSHFKTFKIQNEQHIDNFSIMLGNNEKCQIITKEGPFKNNQVKILFQAFNSINEQLSKKDLHTTDFAQINLTTAKWLGAVLRSQNTVYHNICTAGSCVVNYFDNKHMLTVLKCGLEMCKSLSPTSAFPLLQCVDKALQLVQLDEFSPPTHAISPKDILHNVSRFLNVVNRRREFVDKNLVISQSYKSFVLSNGPANTKQYFDSLQSLSKVIKHKSFTQIPPTQPPPPPAQNTPSAKTPNVTVNNFNYINSSKNDYSQVHTNTSNFSPSFSNAPVYNNPPNFYPNYQQNAPNYQPNATPHYYNNPPPNAPVYNNPPNFYQNYQQNAPNYQPNAVPQYYNNPPPNNQHNYPYQ